MFEGIYVFFDNLFGLFIIGYYFMWVIMVVGVIIGGIYILIYYFFMDIEK